MKKNLTLLFILMVFISCTQKWTLISGPQHFKEGHLTFKLTNSWSKHYSDKSNFILTRDGLELNTISFSVYDLSKSLPLTKKSLSSDLSLITLSELVANEIKAKNSYSNYNQIDLNPDKVNNIEAITFNFETKSAENLINLHSTTTFIHKNKVFVIHYFGTKRYYYQAYMKEFKDILLSIKFI